MRFLVFIAGMFIFVVGLAIAGVSFLLGNGKGAVDLTLVDKPTLMTAAYKVYGNKDAVNGKYWLGKLTLKNSGNGSLKNVAISYHIPNYLDWTTPEVHPEILPGQTLVYAIYPRLPSSITKITSQTPSSLEVKIEYDDGSGHQSRTEHRDFILRGIHEIEYSSLPQAEIVNWYDANDNSELNSAWVTEEDPAVRAYYGKIAEKAGGFGTMGTGKEIEQLARSTYNYMVATGMTYSGTEGLPEKKGDEYVLVQSMRLPRDIIQMNTGLCVELAQLWASIAINSGAQCYLVIIPGHCFPVLKTGPNGDGTILPVEATGIGGSFAGGNLGKAMSFEDALKIAADNFNKVQSGETPGIIVDVLSYRDQGILPPELADINIAELNKMLDDRFKQHQTVAAGGGGGGGGNPGGGGRVNPTGALTWSDPAGRLSLTYPAGWINNGQLVVNMRQVFPGYALSIANPATQCGVDVIFFAGATSANQVVGQVVGVFQNLGMTVQTGQVQNSNMGGATGIMVPLAVSTNSGIVGGNIYVAPVNGGMVAVDVGGPQRMLQAATPELLSVVNTVKLGN